MLLHLKSCSSRPAECMVGLELNKSISSVRRSLAANDSIMQLVVSLVQPSINTLITVFLCSIHFAVA